MMGVKEMDAATQVEDTVPVTQTEPEAPKAEAPAFKTSSTSSATAKFSDGAKAIEWLTAMLDGATKAGMNLTSVNLYYYQSYEHTDRDGKKSTKPAYWAVSYRAVTELPTSAGTLDYLD